jgi:4-aminobutyrate aminotransferase
MVWTSGSHASTFGGNPVACTAALAVIETIKTESLLDNTIRQGSHTLKRLGELMKRSTIIGDVRGKGLMIGVELVSDKESKKPASLKAKEVVHRAWKRGVAIITCGVSTIRLSPPLTIEREMLDNALDIVEDVILEIEQEK